MVHSQEFFSCRRWLPIDRYPYWFLQQHFSAGKLVSTPWTGFHLRSLFLCGWCWKRFTSFIQSQPGSHFSSTNDAQLSFLSLHEDLVEQFTWLFGEIWYWGLPKRAMVQPISSLVLSIFHFKICLWKLCCLWILFVYYSSMT